MGRAFTPEPAVDLAAPALRTRCCGGTADRVENHDPDSGNLVLTMVRRLENGPGLARVVFMVMQGGRVQLCVRPVCAI